jgi:hypothetical protein
MNPYRTAAGAPPVRCPNCREPIDYTAAVIAFGGVRVHADCREGWRNGARTKEFLEIVDKLRELIR